MLSGSRHYLRHDEKKTNPPKSRNTCKSLAKTLNHSVVMKISFLAQFNVKHKRHRHGKADADRRLFTLLNMFVM